MIHMSLCQCKANIIYAVKELMGLMQHVSIQHVSRIANAVADGLAKYAWFLNDLTVWWDFVPHPVSQIVGWESML